MKQKLTKKTGSSSLEAVLVLPLILFLVWLILSGLLAETARIKLKGALWRTADELALVGPAAEYVSSMESGLKDELGLPGDGGGDLVTVLATVLPVQLYQDLLAGQVLDLAASKLVGPVALARLLSWLDQAEDGQPGLDGRTGLWRRTVSDLALFIDWQADKQQAWLCLTWQKQLAFTTRLCSARAVVPLWTGHQAARQLEKPAGPSLWQLDNFARGQAFRQQLGANLPYDFPVIAAFNQGTATSIKSLDLTAPTYATASATSKQIRRHLADLAGFAGADYKKDGQEILLRPDQIKSRHLLLVIPENSSQAWLAGVLADLTAEAAAAGIRLEIRRSGHSSRYAAESLPQG